MELDNTTAAPAELLEQVNKAITTVLVGGQSYRIGSRQLTRADLAMLKTLRDDLEAQLAADESGPCWGAPTWHFSRGGKAVSFIDSMIAAVSPKKAYEREAWRQGLEAMRGYDAAGFGRINSGWRAHNESAEITDRYSRDVVRARARDLERNSDILQAVVLAYKRNVVGKGFTLRARTGDDDLNRKIEKLWRQWCKARNCDVTGEQSFTEILRMAVERKKVDGGILFLFRHTSGGVVPFKLQAIEVDELDVTQSAPHRQGNRVVGGIEYNSWRRPVGYWIQQYDLEGWRLLQPIYIDAKDAYFLKSKRRPSQIREMSDMSHTITRIRDVNEFINAVSVKERIAACLAVLIKKTIPTGTSLGRSGVRGLTAAWTTPARNWGRA